jgi:hypothetical protein
MSFPAILIILLMLALVGALPLWPYSRKWGYNPSVILAAGLLVLGGLVLVGRIGAG